MSKDLIREAKDDLRKLMDEYMAQRAGKAFTETELADFSAAVHALSDGKNRILIDEFGIPSVMVAVESLPEGGLVSGAGKAPHPAFDLGDRTAGTVWVSKYQNVILNGLACSLPMTKPLLSVSCRDAAAACDRKGAGFRLTSSQLRAFLALSAKKNGRYPGGNTELGHNYYVPEEKGILTSEDVVLTGSGPLSWSHDGTGAGIFDLVGNLNEWDRGYRISDGEIQILPVADQITAPDSEDEPLWRAILPDGTLTAPGSKDTLCFDSAGDGKILLTTRKPTEDLTLNCAFGDFTAEPGLTVPTLLKSMAIFPEEDAAAYDGWRWLRTKGTYYPLCGGGNKVTYHAGIFFIGMTHDREFAYNLSGFRSMYIEA